MELTELEKIRLREIITKDEDFIKLEILAKKLLKKHNEILGEIICGYCAGLNETYPNIDVVLVEDYNSK